MLTYGFKGGTDLVLEVVNGSGIGDSEANPNGNFDADKYKNVLGRVSQDIGDEPARRRLRLRRQGAGADRPGQQHVDGRRRRHLDLAQAGTEPAVRGAARQEPLFPAGSSRARHARRLRRVDLPAARRRQPLVRGGAVQLGRLRPGRSGLHGRLPCTAAGCCGAISAWSAEATYAFRSSSGKYPRFGVGLVTAF